LIKEGKKVIVIEQHSQAGGYAANFKRAGFSFEAGIHAIDGIRPGTINYDIFSEFGLINGDSVNRIPELYTVIQGDFRYTLPDDLDNAERLLRERFPHESRGIKRFCRIISNLRREILTLPARRTDMHKELPFLLFKYPSIARNIVSTLGGLLDRCFRDETLKILLAANTGYYHHDPYQYSALHYGGAQGGFLTGGAFFLKGGSERLVKNLSDYINTNGGRILYRSKVTSLTAATNKKIDGLIYKNHNGETTVITAKNVIANNPLPLLWDMLPQTLARKMRKKYGNYRISHSLFTVYLGLKNAHSLQQRNFYSMFLLPPQLKSIRQMAMHNSTANFNDKIISMVDYGYTDNELGVTRQNVCAISVIDDAGNWQKLSRPEYLQAKKERAAILIGRLEEVIPGLTASIDHIETATPLTLERYTLNPGGCIYGYSQDRLQVGPQRPQSWSGIPGLYFASAWSKPGGGITAVAKCGYVTALEILQRG